MQFGALPVSIEGLASIFSSGVSLPWSAHVDRHSLAVPTHVLGPCRFLMNLSFRIGSFTTSPLQLCPPWDSRGGGLPSSWACDALSAFQSIHSLPSLVPPRTGIFPQSSGSVPGAVPCPSDEPRGSLCQLLDSSSVSQQPGSFRKYQPSAQFVLNAENCLLQFLAESALSVPRGGSF